MSVNESIRRRLSSSDSTTTSDDRSTASSPQRASHASLQSLKRLTSSDARASFFRRMRVAECDVEIVRHLAHSVVRYQTTTDAPHGCNENDVLRSCVCVCVCVCVAFFDSRFFIAAVIRLDFARCVEMRSPLPEHVLVGARSPKSSTHY
jgi:hypothetical protein